MQTYRIVNTDLDVSRIALGGMTLAGSWDAALPVDATMTARARRIIETALELGVNFFDHADIYCHTKSESVFGNVMRESPHLADQVIVQTKCGVRFGGSPDSDSPPRYDFSYDHIVNSAEQSLRRLGVDRIDILLLHRPDPLVEPDEVARAFDHLQQSGKVRYFGVSNHTQLQIELLRRSVRQAFVVNQLQLSLAHPWLIDEGVMTNRAGASFMASSGLLDYCRLNNIMVQAWAPAAQGRLARLPANATDHEKKIAAEVARIAAVHGTTTDAIVLAWILRHPAGIQPILGTANPEHLRNNVLADSVTLSREQWWSLLVAARGGTLP